MKEEIPKEILEIINFTEENKENFLKYSQVRSKELYYDMALFLKEKFLINDKKIPYNIINDCIRLDKSIRNILYKFLATYEEQIKSKLLKDCTLTNNKIGLIIENDVIFPNNLVKNWLENPKNYSSRNIINVVANNNDLIHLFKKDILININSLRNKVMHHSILLFNNDNDIFLEYLSNLKSELLDPWNKKLIEEIQNSVNKRQSIWNSNYLELKKVLNELKRI